MSKSEGKTRGKGKVFFDRADQVADTGNWDFAIELFLEGILREPDNIERGHQPIREASLKRKAQGGKGPGMMETLKRRQGRDPAQNLVNAEFLLAKEPGSVAYMQQVLKAAQALEVPTVVNWIGQILLEAQRQAPKPSKAVLVMLTQAFHDIENFTSGVQACEMARELAPNDVGLQEALTELSAKYTIQQGKYDQEGSFTKGVKDMDKQVELAQGDMMVQSQTVLERQLERARQEYIEAPTVAGKVNALVDALLKFEDDSYENEAIDVLMKGNRDTGAYQFKMRVGDVKMRQMKRRYNKLREAGDKKAALEQAKLQLAFELEEYAERAANYPTDLGLKYELGRRQLMVGNYDEAIGSLQQAQRDPRRHVMALNYLGQAFGRKGWYRQACETYERALTSEMPEDRAKEIRYDLGDCFEKRGDQEQEDQARRASWTKAQDQFSDVVQIDYNYKDARDRLEVVRSKLSGPADTSQAAG